MPASISLAYPAFSSVKSASYKLHSHKSFQPFRNEISIPPRRSVGTQVTVRTIPEAEIIYLASGIG